MEESVKNYYEYFDAGEVFSGKSSGTQVKGFSKASEYTPIIDTNYYFHRSSRNVAYFNLTNWIYALLLHLLD